MEHILLFLLPKNKKTEWKNTPPKNKNKKNERQPPRSRLLSSSSSIVYLVLIALLVLINLKKLLILGGGDGVLWKNPLVFHDHHHGFIKYNTSNISTTTTTTTNNQNISIMTNIGISISKVDDEKDREEEEEVAKVMIATPASLVNENEIKIYYNNNQTEETAVVPSSSSLSWPKISKKSILPSIKIPFPVFVTSLPKSGTTTIHNYFLCGKQRSQHHDGPIPTKRKFIKCRNQQQQQNEQQQQQQNTTTATTSVHQQQQQHKHQCHRWLSECIQYNIYGDNGSFNKNNNLKVKNPPFLNCGKSDIFSDSGYETPKNCYHPTFTILKQIYQFYPNSTILHIYRNPITWLQSIKTNLNGYIYNSWKTCHSPDGIFPLLQHVSSSRSRSTSKTTNSTTHDIDIDDSIYLDLYKNHTNYIRQFVQNHPSMTYIELQLEDPNISYQLETFIGISHTCWSHANCQQQKQKRSKETKRHRHGQGSTENSSSSSVCTT